MTSAMKISGFTLPLALSIFVLSCAGNSSSSTSYGPLTEEGVVPPPAESIARATQRPSDVDCSTTPPRGWRPPPSEERSLEEDARLLSPERADKQAPETFWVKFSTTSGPFVVKFRRVWAPRGVDRVYNLIDMNYYDGVAFFRVIENFMVQFGIHWHPKVNEAWKDATIPDDPVQSSNVRGTVAFARSAAPDSRTVQLYINYADNSSLDSMKFTPLGTVTKCMKNVDALYGGYGEGAPRGDGPAQNTLQERGNAWLREAFPKLDYITEATFLKPPEGSDESKTAAQSDAAD